MKQYLVVKDGYLCHRGGLTAEPVLMTAGEAIQRASSSGTVKEYQFFEAVEVEPVQTGWSLPS